MWECGKCHEKVEDTFDVCWNCGTSREGFVDPDFQREDTGDDTAVRRGLTGDGAAPQSTVPRTAPPSPPAAPGPAVPPAEGERAGADHPVAHLLVKVFRVLAVVVAILYLIVLVVLIRAASQAEEMARKVGRTVELPGVAAVLRILVEAILVVSLLLAVAEFLRLAMAVERNTRGGARPGRKRQLR